MRNRLAIYMRSGYSALIVSLSTLATLPYKAELEPDLRSVRTESQSILSTRSAKAKPWRTFVSTITIRCGMELTSLVVGESSEVSPSDCAASCWLMFPLQVSSLGHCRSDF